MKKNILFIEKDLENVLHYKKPLINAGYKVQHLSSDIQLLKYEFTVPGLFIIHSRFLTLNAEEICQHLKNDPSTKDVPVVIVRSEPAVENADSCEATYIDKPLTVAQLLEVVKQIL
jgi:response regulator RpfG family c-di-GMP phosphodiesterase